MTLSYIIIGTIKGLALILGTTFIAKLILDKLCPKIKKDVPHVYIHPLANSDASISDAMKYIKLTNSITEYLHSKGEKKRKER